MVFQGTFDTTNALSGMFLWVTFSYLAGLLNCDLQRWMHHQPLLLHAFGVTAFFFLFTLIDSSNTASVTTVWLKTLFVYALFVLMVKSKWYFVLPVLALLLVDQSLKKQVAFKAASGQPDEALARHQASFSRIANVAVIAMIVVGALHYLVLQMHDHGKNFSWEKFFLAAGTCKVRFRVNPKP
jgi:hypothetical protein